MNDDLKCPEECIETGHEKDECKHIDNCIRCRGLCIDMGNDKDECPYKDDCDLSEPYEVTIEKNKIREYKFYRRLYLQQKYTIRKYRKRPPRIKYNIDLGLLERQCEENRKKAIKIRETFKYNDLHIK